MPTYTNNTAARVTANFVNADGIKIDMIFEAGETKQTEYKIVNASLTTDSETPYFNPQSVAPQTVVSTGAGDPKTIDIDLDTRKLVIWNANDVLVTLFFEATANTPGMFIYPQSSKTIDLNHNVDQVVLQFSAAATIYTEELK